MNYGVGHRQSSDLALLWLWPRLAATALTRPLAWEPPYTAGAAQKRQKTKAKTNKQKNMWYICTMDYYASIKKNEILPIL